MSVQKSFKEPGAPGVIAKMYTPMLNARDYQWCSQGGTPGQMLHQLWFMPHQVLRSLSVL